MQGEEDGVGSMRGSVAIKDPVGVVLDFAFPVFLKGIFRRFCGVTSTIVMNGFIKAGTLTTIKDAKAVVFLVCKFMIKVATKFAILATRGFNTKSVRKVQHAITKTKVLSFLVKLFLAIAFVLFVGPLLRLVRAPSSVFTSTCGCVVVIDKKVLTRVLCGLLSDVLETLKGDGVPLCFLVVDTLLGVILSLILVVMFRVNTPNTTVTAMMTRNVSNMLYLVCVV